MLAAAMLRLIKPSRFQIFCFGTMASFYLLLAVLDEFQLGETFARQGLHSTLLIFASYLAIGAVLESASFSRASVVAALLCVGSLVVRLHFPNMAAQLAPAIPAWAK